MCLLRAVLLQGIKKGLKDTHAAKALRGCQLSALTSGCR